MSNPVTYSIRQAAEIVGEAYSTVKHWRQKGFLGSFEPNRDRSSVEFSQPELLRLGVLRSLFRNGVTLAVASEAAAFVASVPNLDEELAAGRQFIQIVGGSIVPTLFETPPTWRDKATTTLDVAEVAGRMRNRGRAIRRKAAV